MQSCRQFIKSRGRENCEPDTGNDKAGSSDAGYLSGGDRQTENQTVDQDLRPGHDAGKGRALFLASGASCDGAVAGV